MAKDISWALQMVSFTSVENKNTGCNMDFLVVPGIDALLCLNGVRHHCRYQQVPRQTAQGDKQYTSSTAAETQGRKIANNEMGNKGPRKLE